MSVGGGGIRVPHTGAIGVSHSDRIDSLERQVASQSASRRPGSVRFEVLFPWSGALSARKWPRYYPPISRPLTAVFFSLDAAGSTSSTFKVYRSGSALTPLGVGTGLTVAGTVITLPSGNHTGKAYFEDYFSADADYLQLEVVSVGSGASDLDAQARFG